MTATAFAPLRPLSREILREVFAPPRSGSVDEWADQERYLSPEGTNTPAPMRWSTDRVPYAREIMRSLTDPDVHHVVLVKPRQVAGTEIINNWVGHTMDWAPSPHLVVQPTGTMAKLWSKDRLAPMLRDTPALRGKVRDGSRRRDSDDTIDRKVFPGGYVAIASAKSTAQLRSRPIGKIAFDERDESEEDLKGQGDPLEILIGATATFWDWKLFEVSTPVDWDTSAIWGSWQISDQRLYDVPCPFCNLAQPLVWRDGEGEESTPEGGDQYRLVCEKDARGEPIPESARYQCAGCARLIEERWKAQMLAAGAWVPRLPGREVRGYRLGGLYSFLTWAEVMRRFLRTQRIPAKLKTFVNLTLGLPFREAGARIEPHYLRERAESYGEGVDVPPGVGLITYGVDVQGTWLEVGVWGFGAEDQTWVIAQVQLEGDPGQDKVWGLLAELLDHRWHHASGRDVLVSSVALDANYQTDRVHAFARRFHRADRPVIATIGRDGRGRPILTPPAVAVKYKKGRGDRPQSHILGKDSARDMLASRLRVREPGPGFVHFPDTLDPVFYEQVTSEELKTVYVEGRPTRKWILKEGRRNDHLAAACLALSAYFKPGPRVTAQVGVLAERLAVPGDSPVNLPTATRARRMRSRGVDR